MNWERVLKIAIFLAGLLISMSLSAQPTTQSVLAASFNAVSSSPGGTSDFQVTGLFNDLTGQYTGGDVSVGMIFWDTDYNRFEIMAKTGTTILTLDVRDINSAGMVSNGIGAIIEETNDYPPYVAGISAELQSAINNHFIQVLAADMAGQIVTGIFNRDTVFQSSHGYTVPAEGFIPVFNDGSVWGPANSSGMDSLPESFIVEVISADTFVLQESGLIYVSGHGLTVGARYYLLDNGTLSTTPDNNGTPTNDYDVWVATVYGSDVIALKNGRSLVGAGGASGSHNVSFAVNSGNLEITDGAGTLSESLADINNDWTEEIFEGVTGTDVVAGGTLPSAGNIIVVRGGLEQTPGATEDYTISGNTITFNRALAADERIKVRYRAD